jgi:uncharacterized membrane protein
VSKIASGLSALIGLWVIVAPWDLKFSGHQHAMIYSIVVGAILLIVSAWGILLNNAYGWGIWQFDVAVVCGVLLVILPFMVKIITSGEWTIIILGAVVILLNLYLLMRKQPATA